MVADDRIAAIPITGGAGAPDGCRAAVRGVPQHHDERLLGFGTAGAVRVRLTVGLPPQRHSSKRHLVDECSSTGVEIGPNQPYSP
jgi:hypothetical protein